MKFAVFWTICCCFARVTGEESKLLLVHAIWNHGSHSALKSIPSYHDDAWWPEGLGAISNEGMVGAYELGSMLKERYYMQGHQLLNENSLNQLYVSSSDRNLTLQSAYATVAGLMPSHDVIDDQWPKGWKPIPVHSKEPEYLTNSQLSCPAANEAIVQKLFSAPWFLNEVNLRFLHNLIERSGYGELETLEQLYYLWDSLYSIKYAGLPWPSWMEEGAFRTLKSLLDAGAAISYNDHSVARLKGGPLLSAIIDRINLKMHCLNQQLPECQWINQLKLYAYSTDDFTLHALLASLGAAHAELPEPSSALLLELWQNIKGDFEIKVIYRRSSQVKFRDLLISGCKDLICPLNDFISRSADYIPADWHAECGLPTRKTEPQNNEIHTQNIDQDDITFENGEEAYTHIVRNCAQEADRSRPKDCFDWAVFGYCDIDLGVKYLFCRHTCLCNTRFAKRN